MEKCPHPAQASNRRLQRISDVSDTQWREVVRILSQEGGQTSQDCRRESRDTNHREFGIHGQLYQRAERTKSSPRHKTEEKRIQPTYLVSGVAEGLGHSAGVPRGSDPSVPDRPHRESPGKGGPHRCLPRASLFGGRRLHMLASLLSVCLLCGRKQK